MYLAQQVRASVNSSHSKEPAMNEYKYNLHPVEAQRLLDALLKLKKKGPPEKGSGLCIYLSHESSEVIPRHLVQEWPEHPGSVSYPVPHPYFPPAYGYTMSNSKWDKRTQYGKARWRLVDFLIEKLEEIVNER